MPRYDFAHPKFNRGFVTFPVKEDTLFEKFCKIAQRNRVNVIKSQMVITTKDYTAKIFNRIGKYFSTYHDPNIVLDGGTWELKLTNTEGEVFHFRESTCYNHRSALSRVSKFIRSVTGLEYLLGFDEDTQYGFLLLNRIDKEPRDVVKKVKKVALKEGFNVIKYEECLTEHVYIVLFLKKFY